MAVRIWTQNELNHAINELGKRNISWKIHFITNWGTEKIFTNCHFNEYFLKIKMQKLFNYPFSSFSLFPSLLFPFTFIDHFTNEKKNWGKHKQSQQETKFAQNVRRTRQIILRLLQSLWTPFSFICLCRLLLVFPFSLL